MLVGELPGAGARACHHRDRHASLLQQPARRLEHVQPLDTAGLLCLAIGEQLQLAVVALQADEAQPRFVGDAPGQIERRLAGLDAAAVHADVDLDEHFQGDAFSSSGLTHLADVARIIDTNANLRPMGQLCQAIELARADHLVGDEDIGLPGIDEHLGLVELAQRKPRTPLPDR